MAGRTCVMNPGVNRVGRYVCCALVVFAACSVAIGQIAQTQDRPAPYRLTGVTEGRFVIPPLPSLKEGEVNEIPVDLKVSGVAVHAADLNVRYTNLLGERYHGEDDRENLPLKRHADGSASVEFTPTHIGDLTVSVTLYFEDGLFDREDTTGTVEFSDAKPSRIVAMGTERLVNSLILAVPKSDPNAPKEDLFPLQPEAYFEGQTRPVPIPAGDVQYNVFTEPGQEPSITVNPATGRVQTVHVGHALIRMSFEGAKGYLCVDVRENYRDTFNPATCADLVPKGESLPRAQPSSPIGWKRVMPPPARPQ